MNEISEENEILLDSGANICVVKNPNLFETLEGDDGIITINGTSRRTFQIHGVGKIAWPFNDINAYYIPDFTCNILSEFIIRERYNIFHTNATNPINDKYILQSTESDKKIIFNRGRNNLYIYRMQIPELQANVTMREIKETFSKDQLLHMKKVHTLHMRTGYTSLERLEKMVRNNVIHGNCDLGRITGADVKNYARSLHKIICSGCRRGKYTKEPASTIDNVETAQKPNSAHIDIMHVTYGEGITRERMNYIISIDRLTKYISLVEIESLSVPHVLQGINEVRAEYQDNGHSLENIHMDSMSTFRALRHSLQHQGVRCKYHTPDRHVRRAEAAIKHIKRLFRATILSLPYACPYTLYPWALQWAAENANFSLHSDNDYKTPFTRFTGNEVYHENHYRATFGEVIEFAANDINPTTDESRCSVGIVLGREDSMRGTLIIKDLASGSNVRRREIKQTILNKIIERQIKEIGPASKSNIFHESASDFEEEEDSNNDGEEEDIGIEIDVQQEEDEQTDTHTNNNTEYLDNEGSETEYDEEEQIDDNSNIETTTQSNETDTHSDSNSNSNTETTSHDTYTQHEAEENHDQQDTDEGENRQTKTNKRRVREITANTLRRSSRPVSFNRKYFIVPPDLYSTAMTTLAIALPTSVDNLTIRSSSETYGIEETLNSVRAEISQMFSKGVWELMNREKRVERTIPTKLFIKAKYNSENIFDKLKSRLVACGNCDRDKGVKEEVAAPTVNICTVMLQLAIAAKKKMKMTVFDVGGAYLHAKLNEEKYVKIKRDIVEILDIENKFKYVREDGSIIAKLNKCLYGLAISGRRWNDTIDEYLKTCGYEKSKYDPCSYSKNAEGKMSILSVYVDDLLLTSEDHEEEDRLSKLLKDEYGDISQKGGDTVSFLGMTISKNEEGININQKGYIDKIASSFELNELTIHPHESNFKIQKIWEDGEKEQLDNTSLKSRVMRLMYVAVRTRPDILYNLSALASLQKSSIAAERAIKHLEQYVYNTREMSITFKSAGKIRTTVFADASFQSHFDLRSHSGYAIYIDEGESSPIIAKSKIQERRVDSVADAEINAMFDAFNYAKIVKGQLEELNIESDTILINEDNEAALKIVKNRNISFSGKAKFMARKFLQITDAHELDEIQIQHVRGINQSADMLTKAVQISKVDESKYNLFRNNY